MYDVNSADLNAQHAQHPVGAVRVLNVSHSLQDTSGNEQPLWHSRPKHGSGLTRQISVLFPRVPFCVSFRRFPSHKKMSFLVKPSPHSHPSKLPFHLDTSSLQVARGRFFALFKVDICQPRSCHPMSKSIAASSCLAF